MSGGNPLYWLGGQGTKPIGGNESLGFILFHWVRHTVKLCCICSSNQSNTLAKETIYLSLGMGGGESDFIYKRRLGRFCLSFGGVGVKF